MLTALGRVLRVIRIEKGLLLKDMADRMGLKSSYISSIENGKRKPTKNFIEKACEALSLDDADKKRVEDAYLETISEVSLHLDACNPYQLDLGLMLGRKFQDITPDQAEKIKNILKG